MTSDGETRPTSGTLDFGPHYSTPQPKAVSRFIEAHYDLEGPVSSKLLTRGMNDTFLVVTGSGERFVFRLSHHRARGAPDVRMETAFISHLSRFRVPVAEPIPTREGSMFVSGNAPEGKREGVLFQFIDGRQSNMTNAADARANGRTLALLHNAAETFSVDGAMHHLDLDHLLHRPLARLFDSGIVEDAQARKEFEEIAERTATAVEGFDGLTWTYCHGDCHGFNARVNDAGEAVFFDFDDGGPGYLAYDLGVFLWAKVSFGRKLTDMWHTFLEGYRSVRPISPADFEAAHRFVIVRHFWLMGEYASRASEWGADAVGWIAGEANFLRSWETKQFDNRLL